MQYKPTGELQAEAERLAAQAKAARVAGEDPMAPLVESALKTTHPGPPSPRTAMAPGTPVAATGSNIGAVAGPGGAPSSAFSGPGATQPRSQPTAAGAEEEPSFHTPYSRDVHHGEHMFPGVKGHETEEFERSESYASPDDVRPEIKEAVERHERQGWTREEIERFRPTGSHHTHAQTEIEQRARGAAAGVTQTAGAAAEMAGSAAQRTKEAAMETGGAAVEGAKGAAQGAAETVGAGTETAKGAAARGTEKSAETVGSATETAKGAAQGAAETAGAAAQSAKESAAAAAERTKEAAAGATEAAAETAQEAGHRAQGMVAQAREAVASAVRVTVERLSHAMGAAKERVGIPTEQPMTEAAKAKAEAALAAAKHRAGVPEEQPLGEAAREAGHSAAEAARARVGGMAHAVKDRVSQVPVQMREMYAHGKALAQEKDAARGGTAAGGVGASGSPEAQAAERKAYTEGTFEGGQRPGGSFEAEASGEEHHPSYAPHFTLPLPPDMVDQSMAGKVAESHVEGGGQLPHQGQGQRGGADVVDESGRQSLGVEK